MLHSHANKANLNWIELNWIERESEREREQERYQKRTVDIVELTLYLTSTT